MALEINEKKRSNEQQTLKIKFNSGMQFIKKGDVKKMREKKFHLYIFEEIPIYTGQAGAAGIKFTYRPLMECEDLATFDESS